MFWIHPETQSRDIPNPLNGVYNPTGAPDVLIAAGWRMAEEAPPVAEDYERLAAPRWEQSPSDPYSAVCVAVDSLVQDRLDREAAAAAQAELDRQAAEQAAFVASVPRRVMYNQYMLLCQTLTSAPDPVRLGMAEVQGVLMQMAATSFARETLVSQYMMALQIGLQRESGIYWWESCEWSDIEPVKTIAQTNHDQMMGALPA